MYRTSRFGRRSQRLPATQPEMKVEETIEIEGRHVSLAVRCVGEGQPFIWGHGLMQSMAQEDDVARRTGAAEHGVESRTGDMQDPVAVKCLH